MKFTPASKGDTYDKMSQCFHCLKEPDTKPFAIRKNTVAAKAHAPSSANFPPFLIRKRLLTDFIEAHECTFRSAFSSALILEGGIDNFPYEKRGIVVMLRYRPDCGENPSVAYSVLSYTWVTSDEMAARFGYKIEPMDRAMDARAQAVAGYRGLLRVYFRMEDNIVQEMYPQTAPQGLHAVLHQAAIANIDHTKWIERVQQFVNDGLVMRAPGEFEAVMQLGRLKMKKGKWVWVQLTKAELLEFGYPSDFKGLLF
ncbi:hypothetical protein C8R43DRAFT_943794 [Mycena crocata]|nr:hypothetical protein C8R43DRAFT_943794 [Mycena crocata]